MTLAAAQIEASPDLAESVAAHVRLATTASTRGSELVIFPELSLTGYSRSLTANDAIDLRAPLLQPLSEVSRRQGIVIVAGAPVTSGDGLMIASLVFQSRGQVETYTKQHLHDGEEETFVAGTGGSLIDVGERKLGLAICAEIGHPSHAQAAVEHGADVYGASCFFTPNGYENDCRTLQNRAATHRVVVLMANFAGSSGGFDSAGGSCVWDETGQLVVGAPSEGECVVLAAQRNGRWVGEVLA